MSRLQLIAGTVACMNAARKTLSAVCVLTIVVVSMPSSDAQLFKGGQRRAARQGGGGVQSGAQKNGLFGGRQKQNNQQYGNSYQQPGTGLLGRQKEPKTGGLFKRKRQASESQTTQKVKTGLFGKPKEPKTGGLFAGARERRAQEAAAQQRYQNQNTSRYTQQQLNQQASANYVQRSQKVTANEALFQNPNTGSAGNERARTQTSEITSRPSSSPTVARVEKSELPEIARKRTPQPDRSNRTEEPRESEQSGTAIVRSRPRLPERSQRPAQARESYPKLKDTAKDLPIAEPTGTLPVERQPESSPAVAALA